MSQPPPPPPNQPPPGFGGPPGGPPPPSQPPGQPPFPPQGGGYAYPQQGHPPQPPPQQPQQQPWPQYGQAPGPGGYPTAPPGAPGGNNSKVLAIVAAVVAVLLVAGGGIWLLSGDEGGSSNESKGGDSAPAKAEGKKLFSLDSPKVKDVVGVKGGWATDEVFAKSTVGAINGYAPGTGKKKWSLELPGLVCAESRHMTEDHRTALVLETSTDGCSEVLVFDVDTGEKVWQAPLDKERGELEGGFGGGKVSVAVGNDAVAVSWIGGYVGYSITGGGEELWRDNLDDVCSTTGYAGGAALVAVVECDSNLSVHKIDPETGKSLWLFDVPTGAERIRVASTDPVVLVIDAGDNSTSDVMTVSDDGELAAKIALSDKYEASCDMLNTDTCNTVVATRGMVFMPTTEHEGTDSDAIARTNEIMAFDFNTGKTKWKSDAGDERVIVPIRMEGEKLLAYRLPEYTDAGGEVVSIDTTSGEQTVLLRMPASTAETEGEYVLGPKLNSRILYRNGRLFLQQTLLSEDTADTPLAVGFGPR